MNTNKVKYSIDETKEEEPLVTDNPVINEPICVNLFECGKQIEQFWCHVWTSVHGNLKEQVVYRNV